MISECSPGIASHELPQPMPALSILPPPAVAVPIHAEPPARYAGMECAVCAQRADELAPVCLECKERAVQFDSYRDEAMREHEAGLVLNWLDSHRTVAAALLLSHELVPVRDLVEAMQASEAMGDL